MKREIPRSDGRWRGQFEKSIVVLMADMPPFCFFTIHLKTIHGPIHSHLLTLSFSIRLSILASVHFLCCLIGHGTIIVSNSLITYVLVLTCGVGSHHTRARFCTMCDQSVFLLHVSCLYICKSANSCLVDIFSSLLFFGSLFVINPLVSWRTSLWA
jgi:hypothetical protein